MARRKTIGLSARQREVLGLYTIGYTAKDIAAELCLARKTAESHIYRIKKKIGLHSKAQLVRYAVREGLIRAA